MISTRGDMPQYDDSQRSRNRMSSEKIRKRSDKLKDGGMPSVKTHKDQEIDRVVRKSAKDLMN